MKIRQGFVSNSSTTSFCIYGAMSNDISEDFEDMDLYEVCDELGIEYHQGPYGYDNGWIGIEWATIGDDETGAQFKARVEGLLFSKLGVPAEKCRTHAEAWYDG